MLLRLTKPSSTTTTTVLRRLTITLHHNHPFSTTTTTTDNDNDDNWNDAWETAWLPTDTTTTTAWDPLDSTPPPPLPSDADPDTSAFIADMNDNWHHRRRRQHTNNAAETETKTETETESGLCSLERAKRDYRLRKQRIHAGLWVNEIQKLHESQLGVTNDTRDIDFLLHSCSEIFDSAGNDVNDLKVPSTSEFKNKPDGWESMTKSEDGSVWEMSQREEDILLQEFERRMAFCKFRIASFIKTHIFSRRRPIDGWKYMIEVIGPNAKKGKGSVSRLPSLADPATQAFTEDREPTAAGGARGRGHLTPRRR